MGLPEDEVPLNYHWGNFGGQKVGAHRRYSRAMFLAVAFVGLFLASDIVYGQQADTGSDSPQQILLDLLHNK